MDSTEALFHADGTAQCSQFYETASLEVVARDGLEPPTPAFSGPQAVNLNYLKQNYLAAIGGSKAGLQSQPNATIGSLRIAQQILPQGCICKEVL